MEDLTKLIDRIFNEIKKHPTESAYYKDAMSALHIEQVDDSHEYSKKLRSLVTENIAMADDSTEMYKVYRNTLLFDAPIDFDSYLIYMEIDREPKERFYQPRRKTLKQLVDALQDLADDKLDELFISQPPRTGKTSLLMFFVTWLLGRNSEMSNLYCAYSDTITRAFYSGVLEVITDPDTYKWREVFPKAEIVQTNAAEEILNIDRRKRYPSLTCRSLYGTLNGACDCNGFLISDDLIGGIEEALNRDRMISAWGKVDNNLLTRAKEKSKILWNGTRWSVVDPAGIRMDSLINDQRFANRRFRIINLPALDENDESNFDYEYGVGFSTEYYKQRRASFERNNDMASWNAQYQGEPIEREGTVFTPDGFRTYNGELPDEQPDRVFMAVDPAFGGGDYVASPICFQYGDDIYVHDVVYSNMDKGFTQPMIANAALKYGVTSIQFEATKATASYKEGVDNLIKKKGYRVNATTKAAPTSTGKRERILERANDVRELMIFRESGKRSKDYELFMQNVFSYKFMGKNKNDDAPDSLCMAVEMVVKPMGRYGVFTRRF